VAQNLIQNGEFDVDLAGWTALNNFGAAKVMHSPLGFDDDFAPVRGSALVTEGREGFNNFNDLRQCVSPGSLPSGLSFRAYAWAASHYSNGAGVTAEAILWHYDAPGCTGKIVREHRQAVPGRAVAGISPLGPQGTARWSRMWFSYPTPPGTKSVLVSLQLVKRFGNYSATAGFDDVFLGTSLPSEPCANAGTVNEILSKTACLRHNQFRVTASWKKPDGQTGQGTIVPLTDDATAFWFFDASNPELIVKVLDACGLNDRYWVFAGGLTNVEVTLTVTDTRTQESKTYKNPQNHTFQPFQDTNAFATCP
jgi:hypothetical protein